MFIDHYYLSVKCKSTVNLRVKYRRLMADFTTAINYAGDLSRFDGQIRRHFRPVAAVSPVEKQKMESSKENLQFIFRRFLLLLLLFLFLLLLLFLLLFLLLLREEKSQSVETLHRNSHPFRHVDLLLMN